MLLSEEHPESKQYVLGEGGVLVLMELLDSADPEVLLFFYSCMRAVHGCMLVHPTAQLHAS